jgi:hypothetical protein
MKVYVSHKRKMADLDMFYKTIEHTSGFEWILPHKFSDKPFDSKKLFESKGCDKIFAEVSEPATGQGIELGWANMLNIPIVCGFKAGTKPSGSLKLVASKFFEYTDFNDLATKLSGYLND